MKDKQAILNYIDGCLKASQEGAGLEKDGVRYLPVFNLEHIKYLLEKKTNKVKDVWRPVEFGGFDDGSC